MSQIITIILNNLRLIKKISKYFFENIFNIIMSSVFQVLQYIYSKKYNSFILKLKYSKP